MSTRPGREPQLLPLLLVELALASWETIALRSLMIVAGTCSWAEYNRMILEKAAASRHTAATLVRAWGGVPWDLEAWAALDPAVMLAPWHRRATANARRLRRK